LPQCADRLQIPLIATNDVYYHLHSRRELQDVLTCIREKNNHLQCGYLLHENAERHIKPIDEMHRLFRQYPDAIQQTQPLCCSLPV
jgi:error-prone DNA polymerase